MTAITLANELENNRIKLFGKRFEDAGRAIILYAQSATVIRSQAQEIKQLKEQLEHYEKRWRNTLIDLQVEKDWSEK